MIDAADDGFVALMAKISRDRGFSCASYKDRCLRRRVAVRMRIRGTTTFPDYARLLDRDAGEYDLLLDALTINVTRFFRNWDAWAAMSRLVIPPLWQLRSVQVWSAGCASGEEPYSLAALFHQRAAADGMLDRLSRVRILGTDIDQASLSAAARAHYEPGDFADTPPELRARYFDPAPPFTPIPAIRDLVRFARFDLLRDVMRAGQFHLIVCRNVLIYFDRDSQERVLDSFHQALAPRGMLVLGKVETLLGATRTRFTALDARERLFVRV